MNLDGCAEEGVGITPGDVGRSPTVFSRSTARPKDDSEYLLEDKVDGRLARSPRAALDKRLEGVTARSDSVRAQSQSALCNGVGRPARRESGKRRMSARDGQRRSRRGRSKLAARAICDRHAAQRSLERGAHRARVRLGCRGGAGAGKRSRGLGAGVSSVSHHERSEGSRCFEAELRDPSLRS